MKDKKTKKVVIINDINSDTIEQAILILKNNGIATATTAGQHIVREAGNVINSYIKTVEKGGSKLKESPKSFLGLSIFLTFAAITTFGAAVYGFFYLISKI